MQPDVSVIVVTWNALDHVDTCLEAVLGAGGAGVQLEVIVVDNASSDGTAAHVREHWASVKVLEIGRNGGMAAGNNAGMLEARGRSFLLLNSDAYLQAGALRALLDRLTREGAAVAAVAPRLENVDGSHQRSIRGFPSSWRYATEFLYLRRLAPRLRATNAFYGAGVRLDEPGWIEWATGACLLVPRPAVDAVGLMDEGFVMYGEEVDWLDRMRAVGRRVAWEPSAVVTHVGGGSARREWGRMYQLQLGNHVRYMALRRGIGPARRTRALLTGSLRLRAGVWSLLGALPIGGSEARGVRRERARAFREGAATVRSMDPARPAPPVIPNWPS